MVPTFFYITIPRGWSEYNSDVNILRHTKYTYLMKRSSEM